MEPQLGGECSETFLGLIEVTENSKMLLKCDTKLVRVENCKNAILCRHKDDNNESENDEVNNNTNDTIEFG